VPDYTYVPSVDLSYSRLDAAGRQCLLDEGVEFLWQCGWTGAEQPANCVSNLRTWQASGKRSGLYISLNGSSRPGRWHVDQARATIPDDVWNKLRIVSIDVELANITVAQCIDAVNRIQELGKKIALREVACYSSWNAWNNLLIGTPAEKLQLAAMGVLLINAYWDQRPDIDFASAPFGGWALATLLGEQYDGGHVACGHIDVDSDMFNAELLAEVIVEDPNMADTNARKLQAAAGYFQQVAGLIAVTNPDDFKPVARPLRAIIYYLITGRGMPDDIP
jgi:hypothetical protein